jgi:hypothetical protein
MSKALALRKEARALLAVAKDALRFLMRQDPPTEATARESYERLMLDLGAVIERADPPSDDFVDLSSFQLVMTNPTTDSLLFHLRERAMCSDSDASVLQAFEEGIRRTKQRVYVRLSYNPALLLRLRYVLLTTTSPKRDKAYKRLAEDIKERGLTKNPMEVIAHMGL